MDACAKWSRSLGFDPRCLATSAQRCLATSAQRVRCLSVAIGLLVGLASGQVGTTRLSAADFRTTNFLVMAPSPQLAQAVGVAAETFRRDLAIHWLGGELPPWPNPCPVRVVAGENLAAQGVTTYNRSPVRDFQMEVVGSPERILDSVLPHEVTHTVLATYFGRPLPRWADEGICTTVEHASERQKHEAKLREFLGTRRGISMNKLFLMTEYPQDVLPMYAQGYSVCQFLIAQRGPQEFIRFIGGYMQTPSWTLNVRNHYGYESLAELQQLWLDWVAKGSGPVDAYVKAMPGPAGGAGVAQVAAVSRGQSDVGPGGVALASNVSPRDLALNPASLTLSQPTQPPRNQAAANQAPTSPTPVNQSAQASDSGWYGRLKPRGGTASAPPSLAAAGPQDRPQFRPISPSPADSLYSAAQPQPEQGSVGVSGGGRVIATEPWSATPGSSPSNFPSSPAPFNQTPFNPSPAGPVTPQMARATALGESAEPPRSPPRIEYGEGGDSRGDYRPGSVASPGHYLR